MLTGQQKDHLKHQIGEQESKRPAFPTMGFIGSEAVYIRGMTMRQYYKAKIMPKSYEYYTTVINDSINNSTDVQTNLKQVAEICGLMADAQIAEDEAFKKREVKND